jgi:hypothetical protein
MQKLLSFFLFSLIWSTTNAQDITKKEIVEDIETLYKNSFKFGRISVTSVHCEGNVLVKTFSDNDTARTNLLHIKKLQLEKHYDGSKWHISYIDLAGKANGQYILGHMASEADALKLKQALESLIALVRKNEAIHKL